MFSLLIGAVAAALMTILLIGIFAFIMLKTEMSPGVEGIGIICISVVSCFAGGFFCGRRNDTRGFLWGLAVGCLYFLFLLLLRPAAGRNCPQRRFLFYNIFVLRRQRDAGRNVKLKNSSFIKSFVIYYTKECRFMAR